MSGSLRRNVATACFFGIVLAGCAQTPRPASGDSRSHGPLPSVLFAQLGGENLKDETLQRAQTGIRHLEQGNPAAASREFNAALQLDPSRSYLQLLNGLAYHLQGIAGDADKFDLAEQGYALAVRFDHANWLARYFRGNLRLDRRQYKEAQADFAEALLYVENDAQVLYQLAAASYLAGDPGTAAAALHRLRQIDPGNARVLRASAVVLAALGRDKEAGEYLARYRDTADAERDIRLVEQRVRNWGQVHARGGFVKTSTNGEDAPEVGADGTANESADAAPEASASDGTVATGTGDPDDRMVLVDVVIIRTEDAIATRKGTNLLSSLTLQFGEYTGGSQVLPAYQRGRDVEIRDGVKTTTTTLKRAITIPALTYSLNIANANTDTNEILARPTLAALEGVKSDFFSGTELNAAVVASSNNNVGGSVSIEKEIGVRLGITPFFMEGGRVKLEVEAERTFLKPPSNDVSFDYKIETSKTTVNAKVIMNFGETVILSGLSEKETSRTRDGVPVLQDIPLLQYLFSRVDTRDFQRSVLILITPRRTEYVYRPRSGRDNAAAGAGGNETLGELRARYTDWFRPYPNLASVFHHLGATSLYREFRTGDVTLERWDRQSTLHERLRQAVEFLYY
jgi:general secretion pathway protein D